MVTTGQGGGQPLCLYPGRPFHIRQVGGFLVTQRKSFLDLLEGSGPFPGTCPDEVFFYFGRIAWSPFSRSLTPPATARVLNHLAAPPPLLRAPRRSNILTCDTRN